MKYREFIRTGLLAMLLVVPAMFFITLALEGSGWWLIAAVAYLPLCLVVVDYLNHNH